VRLPVEKGIWGRLRGQPWGLESKEKEFQAPLKPFLILPWL